MDFSKLSGTAQKSVPVDPIQLFESLPALSSTPNDLWRGQTQALQSWHKMREKLDLLVSLNTGAGKTIVGILISQSLVNEGLENVVYVCSTNDLVNQTAQEAGRIGVKCTTRIAKIFNNDLFETGRGFCITTYAALFNGNSYIRRFYFPSAVVFDDAHVGESILRDSFTLTVDSRHDEQLFGDLVTLFRPKFQELGVIGQFKDSIGTERNHSSLVPPNFIIEAKEQLRAVFDKHKVKDKSPYRYAFSHLEDHLESCGAIFSNGKFEIAPPFLPSLALDLFDRSVRRVYLSATLQSYADFVRAFGREPDKAIKPTNDAGNGERLIIFGDEIFGDEIDGGKTTAYASELSSSHKVLIATPSHRKAEIWKAIATPPTSEMFSQSLNDFREQTNGAFCLVSRVDGIDLPHDTCRIMIMDRLPSGSSLLEKYQWEFLRMNNLHALRVSNRIAQLFGRINRGRNDYGVFFVRGHDLTVWMKNDRNVSLLPPLLQRQILLGRNVQEGMAIKDSASLTQAIDAVLERDSTWIDYYDRMKSDHQLDQTQVERKNDAEPHMVKAALAEAQYAKWMWLREYEKAWKVLETASDNVAMVDAPIAGWQSIWTGAALSNCEDSESMLQSYAKAVSRLGNNLQLPRRGHSSSVAKTESLNSLGERLSEIFSRSNESKIAADIAKLEQTFQQLSSGSSNQAEAATRELGDLLGFSATRPDNDQGTGPDVLWVDRGSQRCIAFELKTDKESVSTYKKDDIGQGHNHLRWLENEHPDYNCLGLLFVGDARLVSNQSSPSSEMAICMVTDLVSLSTSVIGLMRDISKLVPLKRPQSIKDASNQEKWSIQSLHKELVCRQLGVLDDIDVIE